MAHLKKSTGTIVKAAVRASKIELTPVATASAPSGEEGSLYYDTDNDALMQYGTSWEIITPVDKAYGGVEGSYGSYTIHTFTSNGTFTVSSALTAEILVIGGGGQGGYGYGGGGGSGGLVWATSKSLGTGSYTCTVGLGGADHRDSTDPVPSGYHGTSSTFTGGGHTYTAGYGGGGGSDNSVDGVAGASSTAGQTVSWNGGKGGQGGHSAGGTYIGGDSGYINGTTTNTQGTSGSGGKGGNGATGNYTFVGGSASDTKSLLDATKIGETSGSNRYVIGSGGGCPAWSQTGGIGTAGLGGGGPSSGNMDTGSGGNPRSLPAKYYMHSGGGGGGQVYGSFDSGQGGHGVIIIRYT